MQSKANAKACEYSNALFIPAKGFSYNDIREAFEDGAEWQSMQTTEPSPTISDKELVLKARIEERKLCIYIIEQDLMDHSEGDEAYSEDYFTALIDEVKNHKNYITDYETALNQLKG